MRAWITCRGTRSVENIPKHLSIYKPNSNHEMDQFCPNNNKNKITFLIPGRFEKFSCCSRASSVMTYCNPNIAWQFITPGANIWEAGQKAISEISKELNDLYTKKHSKNFRLRYRKAMSVLIIDIFPKVHLIWQHGKETSCPLTLWSMANLSRNIDVTLRSTNMHADPQEITF